MKANFNQAQVIGELKHMLPSQTPLKDFIHHNSLHAFQQHHFFEAIFTASELFGYQVTFQINEYRKLHQIGRIKEVILNHIIQKRKGLSTLSYWKEKMLNVNYESTYDPKIGRLRKLWKSQYNINLDDKVQPLLFRIISSYLDQGIALWQFPFEDKGLLYAIKEVEKNSFTSFFKTKRARKLLFDEQTTIASLLKIIVGNEAYFENYLYDQQFGHRGWSGMVAVLEDQPHTLLYHKKIAYVDFIILDLLLEIDALDSSMGEKWAPLCLNYSEEPLDIHHKAILGEWHEVLMLWHEAFEWDYYDEVLAGVRNLKMKSTIENQEAKSFQAIFCIDEREDSLRRHIENIDVNCETLGCPGFFGVEFYFQPFNGKFYEKLCPAPVTPKYLIKETDVTEERKHELIYNRNSHTLIKGVFASMSLGLLAPIKLIQNLYKPKMSPAISNAFAHMNVDGKLIIENTDATNIENGLQIGFTVDEMATRVENLLRGIGLVKDFSKLIYIVAHGSSSANNPHHGAHDCGACSGRPGSVNARVFSFMANHQSVRSILKSKGIHIPEDTVFVGALHDTAADEIAFYDEFVVPTFSVKAHETNKLNFEHALDLNAKERSRRFASINTSKDLKHVRKAIKERSVSFFEPRPELGHGTNALCFVGSRQLTKGLFFDRRAFMNSYNYKTDPEGKLLLGVMRPLPPVCGGINLEYYFSRIDNYKLGAGTKLPHNVVGLIGVANSSDGDLRPGLPLQMIEVHDPVRLLILVEHYPEVILNTIQGEESLYQWFAQGWVHLVGIHPDNGKFYYFDKDKFTEHVPLAIVSSAPSDQHLIENAKEMETNYIVHATKENIPVHILNNKDEQ
jgi:uncharacterized protein